MSSAMARVYLERHGRTALHAGGRSGMAAGAPVSGDVRLNDRDYPPMAGHPRARGVDSAPGRSSGRCCLPGVRCGHAWH